jgi:hypothetical protein
MQKNASGQKLKVFAFDATSGLPKTGDAANITAYVSKDYGTVTVLTDTSATEQDSTNAKGYYLFDLAQAETNGDRLDFSAKSSTTNVVVVGVPATEYTAPILTGDAFARIGAAGAGLTAVGDARLANLDAAVSSRSTYAGGAVASVTAAVNVNLAQTGLPPRDLSGVADAALTVGDGLVCAIAALAGPESVVMTTYTRKTPAGTTVRSFTLDSSSTPSSRT